VDSESEMTDGEDMGFNEQADLKLYHNSTNNHHNKDDSERNQPSPDSVAVDMKMIKRDRRIGSSSGTERYPYLPHKGKNTKTISDEAISENEDDDAQSRNGSEGEDTVGNGESGRRSSKHRHPPSIDNEDNEREAEQYSNCKNKYLRDLAAVGLRVGRHVPTMLKKNPSTHHVSKTPHYPNTQSPQAPTNTPSVKSRKGSNPRRQCQSPPSPAVDTLLRVFPTKSRTDVDLILSKTGGDVLKAIEVLLAVSQSENLFALQHHQAAAAAHQHQQLHHQLSQNPMSVNQIIQHQQHIHHQQIHRSRLSPQPPPPTHVRGPSGPVDLAMDQQKLIEHAFEKNHHNNNNNNNHSNQAHHHNLHYKNASLNNGNNLDESSPSRGESPPSTFPFFGPYSAAAAAAAAAAARFHSSHSSSRQFLPNLLPYSIPGLPRPGDFFHGGSAPGGPLPLVTAAAAAAMSSSAGLTLDPSNTDGHHGKTGGSRGSSNRNNNNYCNASPSTPGSGSQIENMGTVERESGTPPTSCSGSDRASYSE
jgi:hypothetical protein